MKKLKKKVLYSRDEINHRVKDIARQISQDFYGKDPILVGVLNGVFIFLADLVRNIEIPVQVDFVRLASYGSGTESSGRIKITKDIELAITGKDVIIVDDIVDTGLSLNFLKNRLLQAKPSSLKICALINKRNRRKVEVNLDYVGFSLEGNFLVGYGLDCDERFRCLPEIYEIED